jgi:hypothetical protein
VRFCDTHGIAYTETGLLDSYRWVLRYLGDIRPDQITAARNAAA